MAGTTDAISSDQPQTAPPSGGDHLQNLYDLMHSQGTYSKTFDQFKQQFSTPDKIDKLYDFLHPADDPDNQVYSKSKGDFYNQFFPSYTTQKPQFKPIDFTHVDRPRQAAESTAAPVGAPAQELIASQQPQDPSVIAHNNKYRALKTGSINEIEDGPWKDRLFKGTRPALTPDPNMPLSAFQTLDRDALDDYLDTKDLTPRDKYWLRNQLISYADQRQKKAYVDQRAQENIDFMPEVQNVKAQVRQLVADKKIKPEDAQNKEDELMQNAVQTDPVLANKLRSNYALAQKAYDAHRDAAVANKFDNLGLDDKAMDEANVKGVSFKNPITNIRKAIFGTMQFVGDTGGTIASALQMGGVPGISKAGEWLKNQADNMSDEYKIPQNGEVSNYIYGQALPAFLNMMGMAKMAGTVGAPLYRSLAAAREAGTLGKFAEGAIGGLAISPVNSAMMTSQYYDGLIKQGYTPDEAADKAKSYFGKNILTDMVMTPLQMGLLKLPTEGIAQKLLAHTAEAGVAGLHMTLQDFNQKSTDNPAMHIIDYVTQHPDEVAGTFLNGAVLGSLQKAVMDGKRNWDVNRATRDAFSFGSQYGGSDNKSLPSNKTIASTMLGLIEMKPTPGRAQELHDITDAMHESGTFTDKEAEIIHNNINDVDNARKLTPKYGKSIQKMAILNELLEQRKANEAVAKSGTDAAAVPLKEKLKESNERIARIAAGKEPLYFVNGNETSKEDLQAHIDNDPEYVASNMSKYTIHGDPEMKKQIDNLKANKDAIQKQKSDEDALRNAPTDGATVGVGDEGKGPIHEETPGKEGPATEEGGTKPKQNDLVNHQYLESRHASDHDGKGVVSGDTNVELSEKGKQEARALADEVAENHNVTKVVGSTTKRNVQTAEEVARASGATHEQRHGLRPWDIGEFDGMSNDEWKKAKEFFVRNPDATEFEGKKLKESFGDYQKRVVDEMGKLQGEPASTMVINHSGNMAVWDAYTKNGGEWNDQAKEDFLNAKPSEPATMREPNEVDVAGKMKDGEISNDELLNKFKQAINETTGKLQQIRQGDTTEAGGDQADAAHGQGPEGGGHEAGVPAPEPGTAATTEDTTGKPVSGDTGTTNEAGVTQKAAVPGQKTVKSFWDNDVKPAIQKFADNVKDGVSILVKALSPRTGVAEKAVTAIMRALGDRNHMEALMDEGMKSFEKMFDKMPDSERIKFIDNLKTGKPQATPELQQVDKLIRGLDKALYDEITKYKAGLPWKEDHFRVLWKTIPGGTKKSFFKGSRPLEGSKGFMKRATLTDMSEGINMGGEPMSTNPITMFKLAYADGMKFITAQRMMEALKKNGFAKFVPSGGTPPDGYVRLNDRIAKVYAPSPGKSGEYYFDPGSARLLNNFLSKDWIRSTQFGRGAMALKNMYTVAELGLSGFHAVAEGLEAISSQMGTGIRKIFNVGLPKGNLRAFGEGLKDILTSPAAPYTTAATGKRAMKFATSEAFRNSAEGQEFLRKYPGAAQYVDDYFRAGGLMKQAEGMAAQGKKVWNDVLKPQLAKDNYIGTVLRAVPAINETLLSPMFNQFIPRLKTGMFFKEFPLRLQENQERLAQGSVTREQLARQTMDFIDDRLGEMNFDNLFWNKTFKTAMQFMLRSVTWKLGNLRAVGGVAPELAGEVRRAALTGTRAVLPPKTAWLMGLSAMQVTLASVIQHMMSGKGLTSFKDVVAPQIDPDDESQRVILPTYYKDGLHLYHDPVGYLKTGAAGQLSRVMDVWQNKDFYNYEISDPNAPKTEQALDKLKYLAPRPFSVTSAMQMHEEGEPASKQVMSFLGMVKAPGYLNETDTQKDIYNAYNLRNAGTKPYAEKEAAQVKKDIRQLYKDGDREAAQDKIREAVKDGTLRPTQIPTLMRNAFKSGDPSIFFFKELPFEDKEHIYNNMTDEEKQTYDPTGSFARQLRQKENAKQ